MTEFVEIRQQYFHYTKYSGTRCNLCRKDMYTSAKLYCEKFSKRNFVKTWCFAFEWTRMRVKIVETSGDTTESLDSSKTYQATRHST